MFHRGQTHVLQVLPALDSGGVERGAIDIALALQAAGAVPLVVSRGGAMVHELERARIEHIAWPVHSKNPFVMRRNVDRLARLILERGVALVHARSRAPAWSAFAAASRTGVPFLTTFHGTYALGPWAIKKPYNAVMTHGNKIIAISNFIASHIQTVYDADPERIRVIPRGVDLKQFDPATLHPNRLIALAGAWRLPEDRPLILLPGRLTRWKGHEILIEALVRLGRRDVCCLLVGADQGRTRYRAELMQKIRDAGLQDVVHIAGPCSDMPAAYMLTDVVVSASLEPEAFGRVAVEAQAMGRPVIATDHGGSRETIIANETGWLVPPGDAEALSHGLARLLALTPETRQALALRQRAHVQAHFSRENMCARTLAVYQEVLIDFKQ